MVCVNCRPGKQPELAKSHFERFGEVEEVSKQGEQLLVRFANRHSGEIVSCHSSRMPGL